MIARVQLCMLLALVCLSTGISRAQAAGSFRAAVPPPYTPQVWDIDWSYLAQPGAVTDWTDRFHYLPAGPRRGHYLAITGQVRERGEYQDHPAFGAQPADNGYFLQRYLLSGDLHLGPHLRTFVQLESGLEEGRDGGARPGIDQDKLDINQAFLDWTICKKQESHFTVRAGRQLVSLGSTRLVAIGAGLNVEQPFDGFRVMLQAAGWTGDALAVRPTLIKTGFFDNQPNSGEELWGLSLTHRMPWLPRAFVDGYYLGFDHRQARYAAGVGREQRETVGGRVWSHAADWDYDFEYTGQFGRFGPGNIRAWGTGYHLGYTFQKARLHPHPEIDGGFLSGDHHLQDHSLGTFNPLFPNGNYLSESILLGPYNLIIARPTLKLALSKRASSNTNVELLYRQSLQDGVYNIVGILTHAPGASRARFIGSQIQEVFDYEFSRHLSGSLAYEHFFAGAFLKESPPGKSVNFVSPQLSWNF